MAAATLSARLAQRASRGASALLKAHTRKPASLAVLAPVARSFDFDTCPNFSCRAASTAVTALKFGDGMLAEYDERKEIEQFAALPPHPLSLDHILECMEPWRQAEFIQQELPIRLAERVEWIQKLPRWQEVEEFRRMFDQHVKSFGMIRRVRVSPDLMEFTRVVKQLIRTEQNLPILAATATRKLAKLDKGFQNSGRADEFLNELLLNRLGCFVLLRQYVASVHGDSRMRGIVDPRCNTLQLAKQAAEHVENICKDIHHRSPIINVESHSSVVDDHSVPKFSYIPFFFLYIVTELLKNSARATLLALRPEEDPRSKPINVIVSASDRRVCLKVSDQAQGIPDEPKIWTYLKETSSVPNPLAGFGVGLPLSRLYASYLGGSLHLVSMPGFGTDAFLNLQRLEADQVELVPDHSYAYKWPTYRGVL